MNRGGSPAALRRPVRAIVVSYGLALTLSWAVWGTTIAQQRGLLGWHLPQPLAFWVGLTVASLVGAAVSGGRPALGQLLAALVRWRVGWRWYAAALVVAVGLPVLGLGLHLLLGGPAPTLTEVLPASQLPQALLVETALFWLTEEPLWRGLILPRLELCFTPGVAALVVGAAWAVWHLPLFAIAGSFQSGLPVAGFVCLTMATSVILSWLYHGTGGSLPVCALYHGVVDVAFVATGVLGVATSAFWIVVALHVLVAGAVWWRGGLRGSGTRGRP